MKNNIFRHAEIGRPQSSNFNLSHEVKCSMNFGKLTPTLHLETLPGDRFTIGVENLVRFAPLVSPVMANITLDTHYFYVPNRIMWKEWENFITNDDGNNWVDVQPNIGDHPHINPPAGSCDPGSLLDFLGYQESDEAGYIPQNPFFLIAYLMIYDEYYRDNNLSNLSTPEIVAGNNSNLMSTANLAIKTRAWAHDYFTSALRTPQEGAPVHLPITTDVDGKLDVTLKNDPPLQKIKNAAGQDADSSPLNSNQQGEFAADTTSNGTNRWLDPNGSLEVDIEGAAGTIQDLRRALALQKWLEKTLRGGKRYVEQLLSHFGVRSSDGRFQRPEYIGGSKQKMVISEVLSTAQTIDSNGADVPVGNMAGHGISVGGGNTFKYKCEEHGVILAITSSRPEASYSQGVSKAHTRLSRLDYAWPSFANLGEEAILNREIYTDGLTTEELNGTFGYTPRYASYKFMNNRIHGLFKTDLEHWHLGRKFDQLPTLSQFFILCQPSSRIFADLEGDKLYAHIFNHISVQRKLPKYGNPMI